MMKKRAGMIFLAGVTVMSLLAGCNTAGGEGQGRSGEASVTEQEENEASAGQNQSVDPEDAAAGQNQSVDPEDVAAGQNRSVNPEDVAAGLERDENPGFSGEDIRGISVVSGGEVVYQMNYTPRNDRDSFLYWDMVTPYASTAIVNTEAMYELYDMISGLDLTSAFGDPEDASPVLEDSDTYIVINYYDGGDSDEQEAEPNKTLTLMIGDEQEDGTYVCALKGYEEKKLKINSSTLDAVLQQDPYDLILKIPYVVNVATVKEVDIAYGGKDHTMTLDKDVYKINGKKADSDTYLSLYSDLMQPMLDGKIPEDAKFEEDREPLISIRYIRNIDGAEDYEVKIYPYGDDRYTVSVNGEEHFFLITEDVETLEKVLKDAF